MQMLKKLIFSMFFFLIFGLQAFWNWVVHENCNNWIYKTYYSQVWSCDTCWYYTDRFYKWKNYWIWDFFNNVSKKDYLFSTSNSNSYSKIHNVQANVNYTLKNYIASNTAWLTANFVPSNAWINWNRDAVIFNIENVSWNQNISSYDQPLWIAEHKIRQYEINPSFPYSVNWEFVYFNWQENLVNWSWVLSWNYSKTNSTKNINLSNFIDHKECYVMLPAWCWDWTKSHWETCDPQDSTKSWWWNGWCSATCEPITISWWSCNKWTITVPLTSSISQTTAWLCPAWESVTWFTTSANWNTTTYNWECSWKTWWNCTASYTSTWWWGSSCSRWVIPMPLSSYINENTPWLCSAWETVTSFTSSVSWNTTTYNWWCWWKTWWNCSGSYTSSWGWWGWWWGGWGWWWGWTNSCWDWKLDRPNSSWLLEQCDFWWSAPWSNWPSWCWKPWTSNECKIIESTSPWWITWPWVSSTPSWWTIDIYPDGELLIWDWMSVFWNLSPGNAYIKNNSTSDVYIDREICVYKQNISYDVLDWITSKCSTNVVWQLNKNWWTKSISVWDNAFIWDISSLPSWVSYWDIRIITTLSWLESMDTFLKSILKVRVAKPSVSTVWWWASLLSWNSLSDIQTISSWFSVLSPAINRNLILTSLWMNPLSSYVKVTNDSSIIQSSKEEWNKDLSQFSNFSSNNPVNSISVLPSQNFNWLSDVFIHKWNVTLSSQSISWWNKTYIIENWNLTINWNITSNSNILFVVKSWNILISSNVTKIDAIIINIWWNINWDSSTLNRLVVNWALYWNVDDLLSKRTYIKDRWAYVDVWTIVNFTSKIFDSPPPLLSKFLWEYTEYEKSPR